MIFVSSFCQPAVAQDGQLLGGLLRELLKSQYDRRDEQYRRPVPGQPIPRSGELRPGRPRQPDFIPELQPIPSTVPPNVVKARGYCDQIAKESKRLVRLLRKDARQVPGVNVCIDELMRIQARSQMMSQRFSVPQRKNVILDDVRELDREWRMASYRIQQLRGLPQSCRTSADRIGSYATQCCELFRVGPQVNHREISRLADELSAELHHLERDVEAELRGRPQARQLVMQLRRSAAQARLFSDSAANTSSYEIVSGEFKQFLATWAPIARTLDSTNDRHIDRTVEQIHGITRALHEQLWLPLGIDRGHVEHLSTLTGQRIKTLYDSFSLSMLTELPDGPAILSSANKLDEEIRGFCTCVTDNASDDDLVQHWTSLSSAWSEFDHYSEAIDSRTISQLRQEIGNNIEAMRQTMGIQLVFDRRAVTRSIGELEGIAEQAQYHISQWQRRPGASVDAAMIRSAKKLISDVHHLHEECAGKASREHLYRDCQKLSRDWAKLRPQLLDCRTVDQQSLARISDDATARLIRLQTLLEIPQ